MKFRIVIENDELHGREALLQHLKDTQKPTGPQCPTCKGWGKVFKNKERITCPSCKGTGVLKEGFTGSGAGFPAATDTAGNQAIDKFPTGGNPIAKRVRVKKKKKVIKTNGNIQSS